MNSVRQREAPSAAEASRRLGSSRDITLISGSSISGISIWVSEITSPSSVCSRRSGSEITPSHSSTWLTTPSRPSTTIQAKVRTTTESSSGMTMMNSSTFCRRAEQVDDRPAPAGSRSATVAQTVLTPEQQRVADDLVVEGIAEELDPAREARLGDLVVVEEADGDQQQQRRQEERGEGQRQRQRELPLGEPQPCLPSEAGEVAAKRAGGVMSRGTDAHDPSAPAAGTSPSRTPRRGG